MGKHISRFNPQEMSEQDILDLATGREKILATMLDEMSSCLIKNVNQQFIIYGPRGMGKSFFTRLLSIKHDNSIDFKNSRLIQFPEEQNNVEFVADMLDMLSVKLEGGYFQSVIPRWEIGEEDWAISKKRLGAALEKVKKDEGISHVFFTMENLQDFIPKLNDTENGRLREFLEIRDDVTMIGTSIRPDMDADYEKKLFHVFKKIELNPWTPDDFLCYYKRKLEKTNPEIIDTIKDRLSQSRIKAIAHFTGGSPRLAVILNSLVIDDDIIKTIDILNGIVDELTPYYQDLTKDIPRQSAKLFDLLIRLGENVTQSQLATAIGKNQNSIARSFKWLLDNFYVNSIKQKKANVKHFYVRDRLYVLYYQNRQTKSDQTFSFVEAISELLTKVYSPSEFLDKADSLFVSDPSKGRAIVRSFMMMIGMNMNPDWSDNEMVSELSKEVYNQDFAILKRLANDGETKELKLQISKSRYNEGNPDYTLLLALSSFQNEKYENTIKFVNQILQLKSDSFAAISLEAESLFFLERYIESLKSFEKLIKLDPLILENVGFIKNLGVNYLMLGEYNKALEVLFKAKNIDGEVGFINELIGHVFIGQEKYTDAINLFQAAVSINPDSSKIKDSLSIAYSRYGRDLYSAQNYTDAETNLRKSIELNSNELSRGLIAKIYFDQGKVDNFIAELQSMRDDFVEVALAASVEFNNNNNNDNERALEFNRFLRILDVVKSNFEAKLIPFLGTYLRSLFRKDRTAILKDVVDELNSELQKNPDDILATFLSIWEFLIDPSKGDIASLHPDARVAVEAIIKEKNEKMMS